MFDTDFYIDSYPYQIMLESGYDLNKRIIHKNLEKLRSREPYVYNIETTNACNMRCKMCPRTTKMTRPVETMDRKLFEKIVEQLEPLPKHKWNRWIKFVRNVYKIDENDMSENHFFLYIIPKVLQLHGYGEPLLDKNMPHYIKILKEKNIQSYFSCNPSNIVLDRTIKMFENGLDYIKYSIESVDDKKHKKIRGEASNFTTAYEKILRLLDTKKEQGYKTTIVITMLDLNRKNQAEEYQKLKDAFKDLNVYIYLKSEDQLWYRQDYHKTKSIHWSEFCKHPWMSMTIKSNGEAAMCMEDYNNEIVLGDTRKDTLHKIWNGYKYRKFRRQHFLGNGSLKCRNECDMKIVGEYN